MWSSVAAIALVMGLTFGARGTAAADVDLSPFRESLAVHGEWITSPTMGQVWAPRKPPHAWRPYMVGHWDYTEAGWTWASDEPWGWATYHYGRWAFELPYGWVWVPGNVWAPAWVVWRAGGGYVGWAPLPPDARVASDVAIDVPVEPLAFCFVREELLTEADVDRHLEPLARGATWMTVTKGVTRYTIDGDRVVNHGVAVEEVERETKHTVKRVTLTRVTSAPPVEQRGSDKKKPESKRAIARRQERERLDFSSKEADERRALELRHRQEVETPPEGVYGQALRERHASEDALQLDHERREWQAMAWRQQREGEVKLPPAPAHHKGKP